MGFAMINCEACSNYSLQFLTNLLDLNWFYCNALKSKLGEVVGSC